MESFKPVALMAVILIVVLASVLTYSDMQIDKKDDTIHKRDVTICQLQNKVNNTSKKCT